MSFGRARNSLVHPSRTVETSVACLPGMQGPGRHATQDIKLEASWYHTACSQGARSSVFISLPWGMRNTGLREGIMALHGSQRWGQWGTLWGPSVQLVSDCNSLPPPRRTSPRN
jgi:hypothetical protein